MDYVEIILNGRVFTDAYWQRSFYTRQVLPKRRNLNTFVI